MSHPFQNLLDRYSVTHWNLSVYHPGPNPTERVNRVIVTAIRCALNKQTNHKQWDESIPQIAKAIRTAVHDSTGLSPYFLNFRRTMISSGKEYEHLRELDNSEQYDPKLLSEENKKLFEIVRENLYKAYQKYSASFNLRSNKKTLFS